MAQAKVGSVGLHASAATVAGLGSGCTLASMRRVSRCHAFTPCLLSPISTSLSAARVNGKFTKARGAGGSSYADGCGVIVLL